MRFEKIVSGGQTGVDRAALDFAIKENIPHGGWCPKGRLAEDGKINEKYNLKETPTAVYEERTEWNVRDSDGTLILIQDAPIGGTLFTIEAAKKLKKPYLVFNVENEQNFEEIVNWIEKNNIKILNVAGPRLSQTKDIDKKTFEVLNKIFKH